MAQTFLMMGGGVVDAPFLVASWTLWGLNPISGNYLTFFKHAADTCTSMLWRVVKQISFIYRYLYKKLVDYAIHMVYELFSIFQSAFPLITCYNSNLFHIYIHYKQFIML